MSSGLKRLPIDGESIGTELRLSPNFRTHRKHSIFRTEVRVKFSKL